MSKQNTGRNRIYRGIARFRPVLWFYRFARLRFGN